MTDPDLSTLDLPALTERAERLGYVRRAVSRGGAWLAKGRLLTRQTVGRLADGAWYGGGVSYAVEEHALRRLLATPEALARAACYARGVADERARCSSILAGARYEDDVDPRTIRDRIDSGS